MLLQLSIRICVHEFIIVAALVIIFEIIYSHPFSQCDSRGKFISLIASTANFMCTHTMHTTQRTAEQFFISFFIFFLFLRETARALE